MTFVDDLSKKIDSYLSNNYEIKSLDTVPVLQNIAIGKKAYRAKMVALFIDMRNSTDLMINQSYETSARIHKAFATTVATTIHVQGGKLRDFQGDGILAFWPARPVQIRSAVRCAMGIKWLLTKKLDSYFKRHISSEIDFGIGMHWSEGVVVRAGLTNKVENNELIYISPSVNIAKTLADMGSTPFNIRITSDIHTNLDESHLTAKQEPMWVEDKGNQIIWNKQPIKIYKSTFRWAF